MGYKVAIDNGHGINTAGKRTPAFPDGKIIREWEFNYPTAKKLGEVLKRCNIEPVFVSDTKDDTPLAIRTQRANNNGTNLFVSIHYNAYQGVWGNHGGIEVHHHPSSSLGEKLAKKVQKELVIATGLRDRGTKGTNFYVLRKTVMPAILCECGFMDNLTEASLMLDSSYQQRIAEAIGKGICSYLNIGFISSPAKANPIPADESTHKPLYKVQVGAFANRANAESLAKELNNKGYTTYITRC